jgi:hypothetical protein
LIGRRGKHSDAEMRLEEIRAHHQLEAMLASLSTIIVALLGGVDALEEGGGLGVLEPGEGGVHAGDRG